MKKQIGKFEFKMCSLSTVSHVHDEYTNLCGQHCEGLGLHCSLLGAVAFVLKGVNQIKNGAKGTD